MRKATISIKLKHDSAREAEARDALLSLLDRYDLARWLVTRKLVIDESAPISHSHPVLTLNTKHAAQGDRLLATFIHEQIHWHLQRHWHLLRRKRGIRGATKEIEQLFPAVAVGHPAGANSRASSYLHVIVNYLEWQALIELIGDGRAGKVMEFWCGEHYTEIYRLVLREHVRIGEIVRRFGLAPG